MLCQNVSIKPLFSHTKRIILALFQGGSVTWGNSAPCLPWVVQHLKHPESESSEGSATTLKTTCLVSWQQTSVSCQRPDRGSLRGSLRIYQRDIDCAGPVLEFGAQVKALSRPSGENCIEVKSHLLISCHTRARVRVWFPSFRSWPPIPTREKPALSVPSSTA